MQKVDPFKMECQRGLDEYPCEDCPLALDKINAIKSKGKGEYNEDDLPGCSWYISNAEYHYCFWLYYKMCEDDPATDKEICDMLLISKATLEKDFKSAIQKLYAKRDTEEVKALIEMIVERSSSKGVDYGIYMPSQFRDSIKRVVTDSHDTIEPEQEKKRGKKKHPTGLPLHRSGLRVDLYGLSNKTKKKDTDVAPKKKKRTKKQKFSTPETL